MEGKAKHKNHHFASAPTINNSVTPETKQTMNSFLTAVSVSGCRGNERETRQCGCECLVSLFLSPGKQRDQGLLLHEGGRLLWAGRSQRIVSLKLKTKGVQEKRKKKKKKKRVSSPYFFIKLHPFISSAASNSQLDTNRVTFVFLQQFAVELHHLLVFFELQHALAEVEGQRETHFLQRVPVLAPRIHLVSTEDRGQRWVGGGRL